MQETRLKSVHPGLGFFVLAFLLAFTVGCATWFGDGPGGVIPPPPPPPSEDPVVTPGVPSTTTPVAGEDVALSVSATDPQGQTLTYVWDDGDAGAGDFTGEGASVTWASVVAGVYTITCTVTDTDGNSTVTTFTIVVGDGGGGGPTWAFTGLAAVPTSVETGVDSAITATVTNPDSTTLTYTWDGGGGTVVGTGASVTWSHTVVGTYTVSLTVSDGTNDTVLTVDITVTDVPGPIVHTVDAQAGYVGKATCLGCHSSVVDEALFNNHRHNHKLNPATSEFIGAWWTGSHVFDTINYDFGINGATYVATIDGVDHDIVRTLGWGFEKWKQRYIVKIGNSWYITPAQHNMIDDEWVNYHTGDWDAGMPTGPANSYDRRCMGCHTTGGNVEFFADTGEWVMGVSEENVQCEACHGPGETHAGSMNAADIINPSTDIADYDRKLEVCGNCHGRGNSVMELGGSTMGYPFNAAGQNFRPGDNLDDFYVQNPGYWPSGHSKKHHQQFLDFKNLSAHYGTGSVTCVTCHNVHEPDADFTNDLCLGCHSGTIPDLNAHTKHATAKQCIDCHMPYTAKSAFAYDIRSHAFDIISPQVSMDNFIADPTNVIPNSCMNGGCHGGPAALADDALIQASLDDYNMLWAPQAYVDADGFNGGQLYDKFWATETGWDQGDPNLATFGASSNFFRCKQCHGWDLLGNEGAYISRAPSATRPNVTGLNLHTIAAGMTPQELFDALKSSTDRRAVDADLSTYDPDTNATVGDQMPDIGSFMTDAQLWDLVKFLKETALDTSTLYDSTPTGVYPTGSMAFSNIGLDGDPVNGATLYADNCASCHGADGTMITVDGSYSIGSFARAKPNEAQHKYRYGQLGTAMPQLPDPGDILDVYKATSDPAGFPDP